MQQPKLTVDFTGTWIKDRAASDPMADVTNLLGLSGLMRQAIKLIRGVTIQQNEDCFTMSVFSMIGWFKARERYTLDGSSSSNRRRDMRKGGSKGYMVAAAHDRLQLHAQWGEPYSGTAVDEFTMPSPDVLHICSTVTVNSNSSSYCQVYNRKR